MTEKQFEDIKQTVHKLKDEKYLLYKSDKCLILMEIHEFNYDLTKYHAINYVGSSLTVLNLETCVNIEERLYAKSFSFSLETFYKDIVPIKEQEYLELYRKIKNIKQLATDLF